MAPKSEIHIIQLLDWIQVRYVVEKNETEERIAVRESWTVRIA